MTSNADPVRALIEVIRQRFTSGNSIPIERAHITAKEWSVLEAALSSAPPSATTAVDYAKQPGTLDPRSTHRVFRNDDWLPCYCAATRDHWIGGEVVADSQQPAAVETPEEEGRRLAQNECIGLSDLYGTVSYENLEGERFDRLVAAFRDARWGGGSALAAQQQGGAE